MQFFAEYVQPLTFWLYDHPHLALIITFLISFAESLAIIGSIIPGSVTMTTIGILAGSGVMRIDLTFIAATLGAVAGDSASFMIGYIYSDRLVHIWPFSRYPSWLHYGKDFFSRHGGKSVLIGRFIGPLRSIIPVIAGMMHMQRWHFLLTNIISAIGWAVLYLLPGILIGAASSELSAESATHLFVVILLFLAALWLISLCIRWLFINANHLLRSNLLALWLWSRKYKFIVQFFKYLSPPQEKNHYPTIVLTLSLIMCIFISVIFTTFALHSTWMLSIDTPVHLFFQSLRTPPFDVFFILISLIINPISLLALALSVSLYIICLRDWRTLRYWISLCLTNLAVVWLLNLMAVLFGTGGSLKNNLISTFPEINLTFATSLFSFFICYARAYYRTTVTDVLKIVISTLLFFSGLALLYLSDNAICSIGAAYAIGLTIALVHWIFYRRITKQKQRSHFPILFISVVLIIATSISYVIYFKELVRTHASYPPQYLLTNQTWWNQREPILPVYTTNRLGQRIGLFNIQYAGSLNRLQHALVSHGWKQQSDLFFYSLLLRAGGQHAVKELPLMAQLYLNKKPELIMTYDSGKGQNLYILRLWRSNYHLNNYLQPIWIGSIIHPNSKTKLQDNSSYDHTLFKPILTALDNFHHTFLKLPIDHLKSMPLNITATFLIIKDKSMSQSNND